VRIVRGTLTLLANDIYVYKIDCVLSTINSK